jgi:hypothetical protein
VDLTFAQMFDDLTAAARQRPLPAEYFTLAQFCDRSGLKDRAARQYLQTEVDAGKLRTDIYNLDGRRVRLWWFVEAAV